MGSDTDIIMYYGLMILVALMLSFTLILNHIEQPEVKDDVKTTTNGTNTTTEEWDIFK